MYPVGHLLLLLSLSPVHPVGWTPESRLQSCSLLSGTGPTTSPQETLTCHLLQALRKCRLIPTTQQKLPPQPRLPQQYRGLSEGVSWKGESPLAFWGRSEATSLSVFQLQGTISKFSKWSQAWGWTVTLHLPLTGHGAGQQLSSPSPPTLLIFSLLFIALI